MLDVQGVGYLFLFLISQLNRWLARFLVTPGKSWDHRNSKHLIVQVDVSTLDKDKIVAGGGLIERLVVLQVDKFSSVFTKINLSFQVQLLLCLYPFTIQWPCYKICPMHYVVLRAIEYFVHQFLLMRTCVTCRKFKVCEFSPSTESLFKSIQMLFLCIKLKLKHTVLKFEWQGLFFFCHHFVPTKFIQNGIFSPKLVVQWFWIEIGKKGLKTFQKRLIWLSSGSVVYMREFYLWYSLCIFWKRLGHLFAFAEKGRLKMRHARLPCC